MRFSINTPNDHFSYFASSAVVRQSTRGALLVVVTILLLILTAGVAYSQDDPPSELEKQKTEAETRKAIAEARKAELEARFPAPKTSPLEGKTTTNGEFIEGQMIAYHSLTGVADRVAVDLQSHYPGIQTLIVHNQRDIALMQNYYAGRNRIQMLITQYNSLKGVEAAAVAAAPNPAVPVPILRPAAPSEGSARHSLLMSPPLALGVASNTIGAFSDFLGAFRTDITLSATSVEVSEDAVVAELFKSLRAKYGPGIALYYPSLVPPKVNTLGNSTIITEIQNLYTAREKAEVEGAKAASIIKKKQDQIAGLNQLINEAADAYDDVKAHNDALIAKVREQLVELEKSPIANAAKIAAFKAEVAVLKAGTAAAYTSAQAAQAPHVAMIGQLESDIADLQASTKPLDDLNKQFDNLIKELLKTDDSGGISLINAYVQTENLIASLSTPNSYFLAVSFVKGGGNQKVERNPIADVFRGGSKISYSGGVILKYHLFQPDGLSLLSDTTMNYTKYISAKKVDELTK